MIWNLSVHSCLVKWDCDKLSVWENTRCTILNFARSDSAHCASFVQESPVKLNNQLLKKICMVLLLLYFLFYLFIFLLIKVVPAPPPARSLSVEGLIHAISYLPAPFAVIQIMDVSRVSISKMAKLLICSEIQTWGGLNTIWHAS